MATTLALDPRIQVPDSVTLRDETHPLNVVQCTTAIQNQAAADATYDIPTPKRFRPGEKEGFRSSWGSTNLLLAIGLFVFLLVVWIYTRRKTRSLYTFFLLLAFAAMFFMNMHFNA
jgi:hypothetical protein